MPVSAVSGLRFCDRLRPQWARWPVVFLPIGRVFFAVLLLAGSVLSVFIIFLAEKWGQFGSIRIKCPDMYTRATYTVPSIDRKGVLLQQKRVRLFRSA